MDADHIRRNFRGPHRKSGSLQWSWYTRGRLTRLVYRIEFSTRTRRFIAVYYPHGGRRLAVWLSEEDGAAVLRSLLPPQAIAACLSASLVSRVDPGLLS